MSRSYSVILALAPHLQIIAYPEQWGLCAVDGMTHRGTRSKEATIKRRAKALIYQTAFIDRSNGEIVCRISYTQVLAIISMTPQPITISDIPRVCRGLVLHDPQLKGEFDVLPKGELDKPCEPVNLESYTD